MIKKLNPLIGAHLSIQKGFDQTFLDAEKLGCTTIQIFTKSNRQWGAKPLTEEQIQLFKEARDKSPVKTVIVHASYLINLASPDKRVFHASLKGLKDELFRCNLLSIPYLVLHPGSSVTHSKEEGMAQLINALNQILEENKGNTMILLENMAGQGNSLASTFEELATIRNGIINHQNRIGFCFDTCHAFAAGYTFSTKEEYQTLFKDFDKIAGIKNIKALHINDSKKECGCRIDRHEDIGKGTIGIKAFEYIMNDEKFKFVPKILETPKKDLSDDARNIDVLRNLIK